MMEQIFQAFFFLFIIVWFVVQVKNGLFWFYLWQLKEYHSRRLLDHFRTAKGRQIFLNNVSLLKLVSVVLLAPFVFVKSACSLESSIISFLYHALALPALFLYGGDAFLSLKRFSGKILLRPVFTRKVILLFSIFVLIQLGLGSLAYLKAINVFGPLILIDLAAPLVASMLVLGFKPLVAFQHRKLLRRAQTKRKARKDLMVIGITGSYGKTSTKEFLARILSRRYKVLKTKKHINAEIGIAQTILNELQDQDVFIAEIGAYERGKIKQVCEMIKPRMGILTGINEQHQATFGSLENIINAKFELIESLPERGVAILNGGNELIMQNAKIKMQKDKSKCKKKFYSLQEKFDIWAEDIDIGKDSLSFKVIARDGEEALFEVSLVGAHNIENILAVVLAAKELGVRFQEAADALRGLKQEEGSMLLKKGKRGGDVIDSSYSANPYGVMSALDHLKLWPGKKVVVMPCLIELGAASREVHQQIGEKIAEICDLAIITTKDRFREIKKAATLRGISGNKIIFLEKRKEIIQALNQFSQPGDVVLFEGRTPKGIIEALGDTLDK